MPPTRTRRTSAPARGARPTAITKISEGKSFFNWMIAGDGGVGKTVLGGTAPESLFWTFEVQGTESARVMGSTAEELVISTRDEFNKAYDYMEYGTGCDDYKWLIVDSADEMEECFWGSHLFAQKEAKPSNRSLYKAELQDYNIIGNQVKAAFDKLNRLPINVLYLTKIMPVITYDDEGEEITDILPMIGSAKNGNLARRLCGKVSMVGYLETKQKKREEEVIEWRRLYTSRRNGMHAKNRYDWGPYIDNPTIPALVQLAESALAGADKPAPKTRTRRRTA